MSVPLVRQGYYPSDDDYYIILDVDFNASQDEIKNSYKNLARKFHPDKHNHDERSRKEAEVIFQKIKTAYDILSDPHKRSIYDTLGPEGLKLEGWKMVRKQMTAQEIREEYLRLQKQQMDNSVAIVAKPHSSFTMELDASELFARKSTSDPDNDDDNDDDDDDELFSFLHKVDIRALSTTLGVLTNPSPGHKVTLNAKLGTQNGVGDGIFSTIYDFKYSPKTSFNALYSVGRGPLFGTGFIHEINKKTAISANGLLIFSTYGISPGLKLTLTHKIREYLRAKVTIREGLNPSVSTSLIYVNQKLGFEVTNTYKLSDIHHRLSIDFGYSFNNDDSKLSVSLVGSTKEGLAVEYGCQTRVFTINTIGASISLSVHTGITLKLLFLRANQQFNVPIYLSDEVHSAPVFYGTVVPLIAYYITDRYYFKSYREKR